MTKAKTYTEEEFKRIVSDFQEMIVKREFGHVTMDVGLPVFSDIEAGLRYQDYVNSGEGYENVIIILKGKFGVNDVNIYRNMDNEIVVIRRARK